MSFTPYADPTAHTITVSGFTANTFTAVSAATSGIPASATGVALLVVHDASSGSVVDGARVTGSTDSFLAGLVSLSKQALVFAGVNGSQSFDLSIGSPAHTTVYILGYFGSESVFATNATTLAALTNSYAGYNVSAHAPGGVAAFLYIPSAFTPAVSQNGSTDDFSNVNAGTTGQYFLVGLDSSQIFQAKAHTAGPTPHLLGYMTGGIVWNPTAIVRTPGTFGSFQSLATEPNAVAYLYEFGTTPASGSTSSSYTVRQQGSALSLNLPPPDVFDGQNIAGSPAEVNIAASSSRGFYELAYFTSGVIYQPFTQTQFFVTDTFVQQ